MSHLRVGPFHEYVHVNEYVHVHEHVYEYEHEYVHVRSQNGRLFGCIFPHYRTSTRLQTADHILLLSSSDWKIRTNHHLPMNQVTMAIRSRKLDRRRWKAKT